MIDDAVGQLLQLETLVGADQIFLAGKIRDHRVTAGGDQDGLGRQRLVAVGELDLMRTFQHGAGEKVVDPRGLQCAGIDAVQPVDLAPDIMDQRRPVEAQALEGPAEALGVREVGAKRLP